MMFIKAAFDVFKRLLRDGGGTSGLKGGGGGGKAGAESTPGPSGTPAGGGGGGGGQSGEGKQSKLPFQVACPLAVSACDVMLVMRLHAVL